jgi:hypothetical protein
MAKGPDMLDGLAPDPMIGNDRETDVGIETDQGAVGKPAHKIAQLNGRIWKDRGD